MTKQVPRIGVIGCGWWGTAHHMPSISGYDGAHLAAVADPSPEKARAAAERFDVERVFTDPRDLLASGEVDGVIIVVPHAFHYDLSKAALEAGVHVLVEKPMVLRATEAWDLVRLAEERGLHLLVGYTEQYTQVAGEVRDLVLGGDVGDLIAVTGVMSSGVERLYRGQVDQDDDRYSLTGPLATTYADPALGGGQGHTQVTHAMGLVLWTTDRGVEEVSAYMNRHDLAVDLADAISYRMEGGAVGTMASTGSLQGGQRGRTEYRYFGTGGHIIHDAHATTAVLVRNDGTERQIGPRPADREGYSFRTGRALADLIAGHGVNRSPGVAGARTVEFLEAAYRSAETGGPVTVASLTA